MHHPQPEKRFVILSDDQKTLASAILMEQKGQQKVFELTSKPICDLSALPAINILIKLLSMVSIVFAGLIVNYSIF